MKEKKDGLIDKYFSKKMVYLSFFMSIFVIYIHSTNLTNVVLQNEESSIDCIVTKILVGGFARVAVPFFFMMSGYWFFRFDFSGIRNDLNIIKSKLSKKVKSLVVPYLIWNTLIYLFFVIVTRISFISNLMNSKEVVGLDFKNILLNILLHEQNYPMWYVQNLLVLILLTPFFLLILKNKYVSFSVLVMIGIFTCVGFSWEYCKTESLFFFLLGAILAVYYRKFFEEKSSKKVILISSCILLLRGVVAYFEPPIISTISLVFSPIALAKFFDVFKDFRITWFTRQSFFIYCAHLLPTTITMKIFAKMADGNDLFATVCFLITPVVTLLGLWIVSKIMCRITPKLYTILCGGRS